MPSGSPQSGVGRVIAGRYLLLNRLGSGGMGHVWLAHDQRLACEVALKEIVFRSPAEAGQERTARVARARAEARHAAGLRGHPHVVTVHDVLEHEGLPWIVMEYVAGALDLRDLVRRRGPLAPAECARIGLAVLDALTAGHERGIMHRDVKPANILLAPDRTGAAYARVLLTDYGISVQPDAGETRYTLTSALVGTPGYLAPERATGGPPTATADLFSLGCTLYFGVEGCGPFERDTHLAEVTAVVLEEPRPPVRAGALEPVLAAMLAKDPGQRITAEDTEAALSAIVTPQPHPRTQFDLGSQPPWAEAGWTTETGYPGHGPGAGPGGNGTSGAYGPGGTGSGAGSAPGSPPPGATAGTAGRGTPSEPGPVRGPAAGPSGQDPNAAPYAHDPATPSYGQEPGAPRPGPGPTASPYGRSPTAPSYGQSPAATPYAHDPTASPYGQSPAATRTARPQCLLVRFGCHRPARRSGVRCRWFRFRSAASQAPSCPSVRHRLHPRPRPRAGRCLVRGGASAARRRRREALRSGRGPRRAAQGRRLRRRRLARRRLPGHAEAGRGPDLRREGAGRPGHGGRRGDVRRGGAAARSGRVRAAHAGDPGEARRRAQLRRGADAGGIRGGRAAHRLSGAGRARCGVRAARPSPHARHVVRGHGEHAEAGLSGRPFPPQGPAGLLCRTARSASARLHPAQRRHHP
ncbi:putative serine/threonine protein kinase [Streptomyces avermitilis MA-4680 = NBRC 14893]|uniref:non-specific serine/threonine protein kinase n=1 Tax=Streptomyces avermitilis (strain ATCC 31267 / DSM 46492 / JCM 5070 / NBRC 14893 / NCIMB 12804 / NRRL 8165 / MA-4680) TaxID=227882 RepID=Q81ZV3_STRAW|nr:putative serine/threonine protein kinase [Streptomyces avermitilis MA-4680 = NBRC 14893]